MTLVCLSSDESIDAPRFISQMVGWHNSLKVFPYMLAWDSYHCYAFFNTIMQTIEYLEMDLLCISFASNIERYFESSQLYLSAFLLKFLSFYQYNAPSPVNSFWALFPAILPYLTPLLLPPRYAFTFCCWISRMLLPYSRPSPTHAYYIGLYITHSSIFRSYGLSKSFVERLNKNKLCPKTLFALNLPS